MNEWWMSLSVLQQAMFVIGSATLLIMIIQIVMMLVGLGAHDVSVETDTSGLSDLSDGLNTDIDTDTDIDTGTDIDTASDVPDTETDTGADCTNPGHVGGELAALGMRLLSLRCILAFLCFGSWVTFIFDSYLHPAFACLIGAGAGFVAAVIMALIMNELMKLQRDGTIKMKNCVGKEGEVYLKVPPSRSGIGKINLLVQDSLTEFDAVTDDDEPIATGESVKVVKTQGDTLVVERVKDKNRQSKTARES